MNFEKSPTTQVGLLNNRVKIMKRFVFLVLFATIYLSCSGSREISCQPTRDLTVFSLPLKPHPLRLPIKLQPVLPILSVSAVGDIMLGNHSIYYIEKYGVDYPFAATSSILSAADITMGNLEGPFTQEGKRFQKRFTFKVPPKYAAGLLNAGFDVVTLANNHIFDYGVEGLQNTLQILDSLHIGHCGAGMDLEQASQPAILKKNGFRVAVFGYSMTYPSEFWATNSTGGTCYPDINTLTLNISRWDSLVDVVIVNFHWGSELWHFPKQYQKDFAHLAIDAGADLIIGHHPHVLQGVEIYKNRLIAYSLGNFSFASYSRKATESIILKTYLNKNGLVFARLIPISVNNYEVSFQPAPLNDAAADQIISLMRKYSQPLNTNEIITESGIILGDQIYFRNEHGAAIVSSK